MSGWPPPAQPFLTPGYLPQPGPAEAWMARPYPQLLRGPTYRWWRPLLSLAVMAGAFVVVIVASGILLGAYEAMSGVPVTSAASEEQLNDWAITPVGLATTNLLLAAAIPASQLAVWAAFGWRPRWVSCVVGGLRWGWLLRCALVSVVVVVGVTVALVVLSGEYAYAPEPNALAIVAVVLLTTPLQAAGEEYFFRGWLPLVIGSAVRRPLVGGVIGVLVSSTLFAFAHGEQDLWLFVDRFGFGLIAGWLVWRTGGLEAGIALHAVNNLLAFGLSILTGSMSDMLTATEGTPVSAAIDIALLGLTAVVVDRWARRRKVVTRFHPPVRSWG